MSSAVELVQHFEGCRLQPYICPAGHPTIGWGHLILPREHFTSISQGEADALLELDMGRIAASVADLVTVPLTERQFGALVSFAFNLGVGNFRASTLRRVVNRGEHSAVPAQFKRWVYVNGVRSRGLVRRREAEAALYSTG